MLLAARFIDAAQRGKGVVAVTLFCLVTLLCFISFGVAILSRELGARPYFWRFILSAGFFAAAMTLLVLYYPGPNPFEGALLFFSPLFEVIFLTLFFSSVRKKYLIEYSESDYIISLSFASALGNLFLILYFSIKISYNY